MSEIVSISLILGSLAARAGKAGAYRAVGLVELDNLFRETMLFEDCVS